MHDKGGREVGIGDLCLSMYHKGTIKNLLYVIYIGEDKVFDGNISYTVGDGGVFKVDRQVETEKEQKLHRELSLTYNTLQIKKKRLKEMRSAYKKGDLGEYGSYMVLNLGRAGVQFQRCTYDRTTKVLTGGDYTEPERRYLYLFISNLKTQDYYFNRCHDRDKNWGDKLALRNQIVEYLEGKGSKNPSGDCLSKVELNLKTLLATDSLRFEYSYNLEDCTSNITSYIFLYASGSKLGINDMVKEDYCDVKSLNKGEVMNTLAGWCSAEGLYARVIG